MKRRRPRKLIGLTVVCRACTFHTRSNASGRGDDMSERDGYPVGVPVGSRSSSPIRRLRWTSMDRCSGGSSSGPGPMPGDPPGQYFVARVGSRDVAGIGSIRDRNGPPAPAWTTYIRVDNADQAAEKAMGAGASLREGPSMRPPWSCADPEVEYRRRRFVLSPCTCSLASDLVQTALLP